MFTRRMGHPVQQFRDEMGRLFDEFFTEVPSWVPWDLGGRGFPAVNVWEDEQNLYAEAELPGLTMSDVEVFAKGNELTIKGERKPVQEEGTAYHRRERGVGPFNRVLRLPVDIDADKVEAKLHDGVLTITLPKAEAARPRKIEVRQVS
jgi:HSP20 family protein